MNRKKTARLTRWESHPQCSQITRPTCECAANWLSARSSTPSGERTKLLLSVAVCFCVTHTARLSSVCSLVSWRRSSPHGECVVQSGAGRTSPTGSSVDHSSCASCVPPSCLHHSSTSHRSTPMNRRHAHLHSSLKWCKTWPTSPSQYRVSVLKLSNDCVLKSQCKITC